MLETSKDLLNLAVAVSISVLVFFLCWALFYVISSARRAFRLIKKVERGVEKAESLIDLIRDKVSRSSSYLILISDLIKRGIEFAENRIDSKQEKTGRKTKQNSKTEK